MKMGVPIAPITASDMTRTKKPRLSRGMEVEFGRDSGHSFNLSFQSYG